MAYPKPVTLQFCLQQKVWRAFTNDGDKRRVILGYAANLGEIRTLFPHPDNILHPLSQTDEENCRIHYGKPISRR